MQGFSESILLLLNLADKRQKVGELPDRALLQAIRTGNGVWDSIHHLFAPLTGIDRS